MITKRIIPCLDVKNGRVVKGVNFEGLQDMADPVEMARYYNSSGADEVSVNSGAIRNPGIIPAAAQKYGNQCVVLSADIKRVDGKFMLFAKGGRENTGIDALSWLEQGVKNGAGELVVNSIDTDGVKNGFDLELLDAVAARCAVPIIASGGAGKKEDFLELFRNHPAVDAGLQTLGFSGHSHTPHDLEYCMTQSRTALYKAQVAKLKERYAGKLDILCGLEWDLYSDDDPTQYDYWIGSAHYVKGPKTGKYYEIDWREEDLRACIDDDFDGDALAVVEAYFANVAKVAEKKPTILGHFDLIKKINGDGKFFDENDPRYTAAANAALMTAARNRCVLEVNTSAVYRGFRKDFFPSDAILKEWLVLSGNVVITADAHDTKALTYGFEAVAAKLKELGYTKVQVLGKDGFTPCAL